MSNTLEQAGYRIIGESRIQPLNWAVIADANLPGIEPLLAQFGFNVSTMLDLNQHMPGKGQDVVFQLKQINADHNFGMRKMQRVRTSHLLTKDVKEFPQLEITSGGYVLRVERALLKLLDKSENLLEDSSYLAHRFIGGRNSEIYRMPLDTRLGKGLFNNLQSAFNLAEALTSEEINKLV